MTRLELTITAFALALCDIAKERIVLRWQRLTSRQGGEFTGVEAMPGRIGA